MKADHDDKLHEWLDGNKRIVFIDPDVNSTSHQVVMNAKDAVEERRRRYSDTGVKNNYTDVSLLEEFMVLHRASFKE